MVSRFSYDSGFSCLCSSSGRYCAHEDIFSGRGFVSLQGIFIREWITDSLCRLWSLDKPCYPLLFDSWLRSKMVWSWLGNRKIFYDLSQLVYLAWAVDFCKALGKCLVGS